MGLDDFKTTDSSSSEQETTTSETVDTTTAERSETETAEHLKELEENVPTKIPTVDEDADVSEYISECYRCGSKFVYLRQLSNLGRLRYCTDLDCFNALDHNVTEVASTKDLAQKIDAEKAHNLINQEDFNPKTMDIEDLTSDSDSGDDGAQNKREFEQFTKEEFEECLDKTGLDFEQVRLQGTKELVYRATSDNDTFVMRVYSSLDRRTGKARDKGSDAIRTVVLHNPSGKPVLSEKRTNRIKTWRKNLKKKIKSLKQRREDIMLCPECSRVMVIRENSDDGSKFYGCTGWHKDPELRKCSNTEPIN